MNSVNSVNGVKFIEAENQNELNQNETNEAPNAEMHANKRIKNQNDVVKIMIR